MSIIYCETHDMRWDSDKLESCPQCESAPQVAELEYWPRNTGLPPATADTPRRHDSSCAIFTLAKCNCGVHEENVIDYLNTELSACQAELEVELDKHEDDLRVLADTLAEVKAERKAREEAEIERDTTATDLHDRLIAAERENAELRQHADAMESGLLELPAVVRGRNAHEALIAYEQWKEAKQEKPHD